MPKFVIMKTHVYGNDENPSLMLLPGLGVSYEMFLPLISLLQDRFHIVAVEVDGFILGEFTDFTSIDDQAGQAIAYVKDHLNGRLDCAYGLSMGGKILSRTSGRASAAPPSWRTGRGIRRYEPRAAPGRQAAGGCR